VRHELAIFAGSANPQLAAAIASRLGERTGACTIDRFPDGEVEVRLLESVRRKEVFLVQPTSPPVDAHVVELLALADACRRGAAAQVTAVVPYFGYSRADKRQGRPEAIMGRVVADLLESVGIGHVVTVDLHTPQIEGFFRVPMDALTAVPTICRAFGDLPQGLVVVSPDLGRVLLASQYARCLGVPVIVLHKRRLGGAQTEVTHIAGDVSIRACVLVDDMISTGGTVLQSVRALLEAGARPEIIVAATHGLFLPGAREKLTHPAIREIFVTDTVALKEKDWPQLHVVPVAPLIAGALERSPAGGWRRHESATFSRSQ
jgi:ribose-phosphate pyrophosphokinase